MRDLVRSPPEMNCLTMGSWIEKLGRIEYRRMDLMTLL